MSSIDLQDKDGATYSPDVFERQEAGKTVVTQAVTNVDPTTGLPNAATEGTLAELKGVADSLLAAAQAIQAAAAAINGKTTAVNTGDIAGTVGLDAPTLAALETISAVTGGLTDAQLRAVALAISGTVALDAPTLAALETINANTGGLTNTQLRAQSIHVEVDAFYAGVEIYADGNPVSAALPLSVTDSNLALAIHSEDAPHVSGDAGVFMLAIRQDTDIATANDGDYTALKLDEVGRLKVSTQPASYADGVGNITGNGGRVVLNVDRSSNVTISMVATSLVGHNATFEYSNNSTNGIDGNWYTVQVVRSNANTVETATGVLAATQAYGWEASVNAYKWFAVRATAHTSGTAAYTIKQGTYATEPVPAMQVTGTQPVSGTITATVTAATLAPPAVVTDVASAAITTSATTAAFTPVTGVSYSVAIPVTVVSGTSPTLDIMVQESDDTGTNWFDVFQFPRITATGIYRSPPLRLRGNRVRYVQTVTGTTPSFTRAINRLQRQDEVSEYAQLFDRAISLTTLNATTTALNVQGANNADLVINLGAATTPPAIQLEGSDDNANWYALGAPLTGVASSTVKLSVSNIRCGFLRGRISTVGVTVTAGYVLIKGY